MNNCIVYTNNGALEKQIRKKKIIPYMIFPNEKFKANKWYYSFFYDTIYKVLEYLYNEDGSLDHAYILDDVGNYSVISTDLYYQEDYSISKDRRSIYKMDIINNEESFTGAEIVYWFFINNIDIFNEKYSGFWKYVDRYSIDRISDRERYFVKGKLIGNKYTCCEILKDLSRENYKNSMIDKIHNKDSITFMGNLKRKDLERIQEKHKNDIL